VDNPPLRGPVTGGDSLHAPLGRCMGMPGTRKSAGAGGWMQDPHGGSYGGAPALPHGTVLVIHRSGADLWTKVWTTGDPRGRGPSGGVLRAATPSAAPVRSDPTRLRTRRPCLTVRDPPRRPMTSRRPLVRSQDWPSRTSVRGFSRHRGGSPAGPSARSQASAPHPGPGSVWYGTSVGHRHLLLTQDRGRSGTGPASGCRGAGGWPGACASHRLYAPRGVTDGVSLVSPKAIRPPGQVDTRAADGS